MSRFVSIARRIARLAAAKATKSVKLAPTTLFVRTFAGEDRQQAILRYRIEHAGKRMQGSLLIVPAKPTNEIEREQFASRFKASQMKLVSEARRSNAALADPQEPIFAAVARAGADSLDHATVALIAVPLSSLDAANCAEIARRLPMLP